MRFANPKNDVAFKKIFGDKNKPEILMSFLNAVMSLSGEHRITSVEIMNPLQASYIEGLKMTTLDVRAKDASGKSFIVEMQANAEDAFEKRSLFYTSQAYVNQLERGRSYASLQPVYFIGMLDFNLFEGANYLTRHLLLESRTYKHHIKDFELYFIELKKFHKELDELENVLEKWIYFVQHAEELDAPPDELQSESAIASAFENAAQYKWTRLEMEAYQYWEFERLEALSMEEKNAELQAENVELQVANVELKDELTRISSMVVNALAEAGLSQEAIAATLNISLEQVIMLLSSK
jgi:predicted transposase/invertase (TIGR01784 family)